MFLLTGVSHKIHFFMKKVFAALAALAMMAAVVSCEYDSPDIRFQQTTTITNDYSEVVKALQDQTLALSKKMELMEDAMKSQTMTISEKMNLLDEALRNLSLTLSQKMELLTKAYENGVLKYEEMTGKLIGEINSMNISTAEKLDAVKKAIEAQSSDLCAKLDLIGKALALIEKTAGEGFDSNVQALALVKAAIESLSGSLEEKLAAVEKAVKDQTTDLSAKLALIEGAVNSGLVGEDSTLGLVQKAIDALNATAGTANDKLDAIKNAIDSPTSGLNVKLEAIEEALSQGLIDVTKKQDLILAAINSASTYHFTDDELLEKGQDYLLVDAAFWEANHENYEVVRKLKELIKLSVPHKYKFWWQQASGKYAFSGYEPTSFYGPLWSEGGILNGIAGSSGVILAADLGRTGASPSFDRKNGHTCYYLKKVHKSCQYYFHVKVGDRADGKKLKVKDMNDRDAFRVLPRADGDYLEYVHWTEAVKSTTGVWGFNNLKYLANLIPDNSVEFILVEDN